MDQQGERNETPSADGADVFGKLDARLRRAISEIGYTRPTPIQEKAIPPLLDGRDLIGCAQTGTGKTAAFLLPILHRLAVKPSVTKPGHPHALVLSPTRELAAQTARNLVDYSKYTRTHYAIVFGGVSQFYQVKDVQRGAEVIVATPGRLIDLMTQGVVYLDKISEFVLDEADRMLDMGFLPDIKRIISKLPPERHSMFFSATLATPILKLAGELVRDPIQVMISPEAPTVEKINQSVMFVDKGNKDNLLKYLLDNHPEWKKAIVFARTRHGADRVDRKLRKAEISVAAIHSDKTQAQRTRALEGFRAGKVRVLVATDIASRGIDVADVDLVVNMELPNETESYVHRIGRTARAGASGAAVSFVAPEEKNLLRAVERFIRRTVRVDRDHPFHSAVSEQKAGKENVGEPQAPWIRGGERNRNGVKRHPGANFWPRKAKGEKVNGERVKGNGEGRPHDGKPFVDKPHAPFTHSPFHHSPFHHSPSHHSPSKHSPSKHSPFHRSRGSGRK